MNEATWHRIAASGSWFASAPPALQQALLACATPRHQDDGTRLFSRGDAPDGLYAVVEGAVRITGLASDGREALLAIVEPSQWFGEIGLLDGLPRTHDARAQGATVVLHAPQRVLLGLLESQPALWQSIGLLATSKLRAAFQALEDMALLPAEHRLAARLLAMSQGYDERTRHTRRVVRLSQEQLASMLALSRQTVNQVLQGLAQQGIVRPGRGMVEILDVQRLRALAGRTR